MTTYTRREFGGVVAGALAAAPFVGLGTAQKAASSRIAGVRVGTQSYSFRDRSLDDAIAAMASVGLSYCELWSGHVETRTAIVAPAGANRRDAVRAWRVAPATLDVFREIRRKFEAAGVTLVSYDLPFGNDFTDEEIAAVFEMGKALGVGVITSSARVSVAPRVEPFAAKANMLVGFHNHSNIAPDEFARPEDFATAMNAGAHLGVTLDIGHFTAANFDALAYLDEHHDRIRVMHIKDRKRSVGGTQGAQVTFGEGDAPIVGVLTRLRDRKWDIPALIEYEYRGQDTVEEMRKLLAYCRQVLDTPATPNTLTTEERAAGWRLLFDGKTIDQWRGFKEQAVPAGWRAVDGTIKQVADGPDLVSLEEYGSFDFRFDWIVEPGANSGVMYHVSETAEQTYHTGPEYQVLDNARHDDGKNPLTSAAACHSLYAPPKDVSRPANAWNEGRVVIDGNRVEHWLNGEKTVSYELGSAEWIARVAASKFNEWKTFGTFPRGRLTLQQHGGGVAFRNLKIRAK